MSAKKTQPSKAGKIRELSASDIQLELTKLRQELLDLRIRKASGQVENPIRLRTLRREIARLATIAREKQAATV